MLKFFSLIILISIIPPIYSQTSSQKFDEAMSAYHNQQYVQSNRLFEEFFNEYKIVDEVYATAKYFSAESLLKLAEKMKPQLVLNIWLKPITGLIIRTRHYIILG